MALIKDIIGNHVGYLLLRRLNTIHQGMANIIPPCPSDIPPNRGELKGGKTDELTMLQPFYLPE